MKIAKKSLFIHALLLGVSLILFASTTYAYFTSHKQSTGTITAGNVSIALSEAAVVADSGGNLVEDTSSPRIFGGTEEVFRDYGKIYPGQSIYKDPTILNTGTENAFIAAKVIITDGDGDIHRVMGFPGYDDIDITWLIGGGLLGETAHFGTWNGIENVTYNDKFAMIQIPDRQEGRYEFCIFMLSPFEQGEDVTVFEQMAIPPEWTSEQMKELVDIKITVKAYGVQVFGFESCFEAMTKAFPGHFDF